MLEGALAGVELDFEEDDKIANEMLKGYKEEPYVLDLAMKFLIITFCDMFSTISLAVVIKIFSEIPGVGYPGKPEDGNKFVFFSSIDLSCDIIFLLITIVIWKKKGKGGF